MEETAAWDRQLTALLERMRPYFTTRVSFRRLTRYVGGLLANVERKNGWQLAEDAGEATPYAMQQFLYRGTWDMVGGMRELRRYVAEHLGDQEAVLVGDEVGFLKQGTHSVGVQRQYSGTVGRVENCQIGVFLGYVSRFGRALLDREMYLPKVWVDDRERREAAGVPRRLASGRSRRSCARWWRGRWTRACRCVG